MNGTSVANHQVQSPGAITRCNHQVQSPGAPDRVSFTMTIHQIWSCQVTLAASFENFYF